MSPYTCAFSFLIHICSVDLEEWDHNWNLFRAMVSPPCWVLQQSDFIHDFISSLSFCINRKKRWMEEYAGRNALAEGPYFRHSLTMSESKHYSWNLSAGCPHTCFMARGPVSQHPALAWGRRRVSQLIVITEYFYAVNWSQHRDAQAAACCHQ